MIWAASEAALTAVITGIASLGVATVAAIAAVGARQSSRRTEDTATKINSTVMSVDDAVNHRPAGTPRLFDLVRQNASNVSRLGHMLERHMVSNQQAHQDIRDLIAEHATWEEQQKWPDLESKILKVIERDRESRTRFDDPRLEGPER